MRTSSALLSFSLIAIPLVGHADAYRCTDSTGKVYVASQPCEEGQKSKTVKTDPDPVKQPAGQRVYAAQGEPPSPITRLKEQEQESYLRYQKTEQDCTFSQQQNVGSDATIATCHRATDSRRRWQESRLQVLQASDPAAAAEWKTSMEKEAADRTRYEKDMMERMALEHRLRAAEQTAWEAKQEAKEASAEAKEAKEANAQPPAIIFAPPRPRPPRPPQEPIPPTTPPVSPSPGAPSAKPPTSACVGSACQPIHPAFRPQ